MNGPRNSRRDWGRLDRNTPRTFFDTASRDRVGDLAGEIAARPVIDALEVMLQAEAARQQRMHDARSEVRRGDPGE